MLSRGASTIASGRSRAKRIGSTAQARTLLGDLRQLEIQRDIAIEQVTTADTAITQAQASLQQTTARLAVLEQERLSQLPDLKLRLVDIYERGRGGYARMLLDVRGVREFERAMRAAAALTTINDERIADHRRTLEALRQQRAAIEQRTRELEEAAKDADRARATAQRAVAAREALITQIDERRDLNAQLAGELDVAHQRLQEQIANVAAGRPARAGRHSARLVSRRALELASRGTLITAGFEAGTGRATGTVVRNGIEIAAQEGTPVLAVHPGTVDYADAFTGFGNLVIIDHGSDDYSLYGYLSATEVQRGEHVDAGRELGRVGTAPAGPSALYFELRVDGRSIDPGHNGLNPARGTPNSRRPTPPELAGGVWDLGSWDLEVGSCLNDIPHASLGPGDPRPPSSHSPSSAAISARR